MTKGEVVAAVADRAGLSRSKAREAVEALLDCVSDTLKGGDEVRLTGFGAFTPVARPARFVRNPQTGETIARPASVACRFKAGEALKAALNS